MVNTAWCQQSENVRNIDTHVNFTLCERHYCRQLLQLRILTYTVGYRKAWTEVGSVARRTNKPTGTSRATYVRRSEE